MLQNLKNGLAANAYDVVEFFNGQAAEGSSEFETTHKEAKYRFVNDANLQKFKKSPDAFTPQYGGYCAIAMSEGKQVNPNPKSFVVQDGKLYFFTRLLFGLIDAKRQWVKAPEQKQKLADAAYKKLNG
ncbi:MAG: YHS domain-containing (seleno)protein [Flavobacteriaceae bacterium]|nr:YHS domain-containing (seleno)protein [Flavobacteriaceae bacterium]